MNNRRTAIVVGHSDFAVGIISAVERITGRGDLFVPMSNAGLGADDIEQRLTALVAEHDASVIFTDLAAGSCSIAACRLARERDGLVVVTGVNLPALLHYATHTDLPPGETAARAVERARDSVRLLPA
jgi:PTS system N-acetylgalactosamine-specific IIA component